MQRQASIEEKHCDAESLHVAVAPSNSLNLLNGAIHSLGLAVVPSHMQGIDYPLVMSVKHLDDLGDFWNFCIQRTLSPHGIEHIHLSLIMPALDDVTEILLDPPCRSSKKHCGFWELSEM